MPGEIKIPAVGESITEVQISEWLKSEGDNVKQDEPIAVIDSEKTTFDLPAPRAGRLAKILHKAGDAVKIGEAVAQIETNGEVKESKTEEKAEPKDPDASNTKIEEPEQKEKPEAGEKLAKESKNEN